MRRARFFQAGGEDPPRKLGPQNFLPGNEYLLQELFPVDEFNG